MPCTHLLLYNLCIYPHSLHHQTYTLSHKHTCTLTHLTVKPPGGGVVRLIGLALLFHLTEQKGSRLCVKVSAARGSRPVGLMRALPPLGIRDVGRLLAHSPVITAVLRERVNMVALIFKAQGWGACWVCVQCTFDGCRIHVEISREIWYDFSVDLG